MWSRGRTAAALVLQQHERRGSEEESECMSASTRVTPYDEGEEGGQTISSDGISRTDSASFPSLACCLTKERERERATRTPLQPQSFHLEAVFGESTQQDGRLLLPSPADASSCHCLLSPLLPLLSSSQS